MRRVIDAMNLIGSRPDGWWRDRHAAIERLVAQLDRWVAETEERVTVVLEQPPSRQLPAEQIEIAWAHIPAAIPPTRRSSVGSEDGSKPAKLRWSPQIATWPNAPKPAALLLSQLLHSGRGSTRSNPILPGPLSPIGPESHASWPNLRGLDHLLQTFREPH